MTEKRFFKWCEDEIAVTLRNRSGSYGGGSEVLVIEDTDNSDGSRGGCDGVEHGGDSRNAPGADGRSSTRGGNGWK